MEVPLLDLTAQYRELEEKILSAITEVLQTQRCIGGPKVEELEEKIANLSGCRFGIGTSSGTDAILCSLMSLGIGQGDEVITSPFTFFATAGSIARLGARPVFVDIEPDTFNINPNLIESAITERTRAIIPVHLFGQVANMDPIIEIAKRHNLYVVEDAAQAISASYKGRKAGSFGICGCFSFFPSKNLGACGDGGMIVTNDEELYRMARLLRNHGSSNKYYYKYIGGNFRLDAIQAAVLLVKLPYLEKWSELRRKNAEYYNERFKEIEEITTPYIRPECVSIFNQYTIRVPQDKRDSLVEFLRKNKIGCEIYYPLPLHLQECFKYLGYKKGDLPEAEQAAKEVVSLPIWPELTSQMKEYVADKVVSFFRGQRI